MVLRSFFFAMPSTTIRSESGMKGSLLQPGRDGAGLRLPGSHRRMGSDLPFKARGLLFPRLTNQHPLTRPPYAIKLRVSYEALELSPDVGFADTFVLKRAA